RGEAESRAWLAPGRGGGGGARRFRTGIRERFGGDEAAAWRYAVRLLTPLRPRIRDLARGMLVHPRHLPYAVAAAVAGVGRRDGSPDGGGTAGGPPPGGSGGGRPEQGGVVGEGLLAYCLSKPGAWQDQPWEDDVVTKVGSKIFAFLGSGEPLQVGLKCGASRETADEWLVRYPGDATVMAYIGRSGWNSLRIGGAA